MSRHGNASETIQYGIVKSSIGLVLAAESERGLCCVMLGDDRAALQMELQERFPYSKLVEDAEACAGAVAEVVGLIDAPPKLQSPRITGRMPVPRGLTLDLRGTEFQMKVWRALMEIPTGSTETYAEIAKRIGAPKAVRAVGAACGANRIAVIIPCHRVVGSDGKLTGYRWGVERKRALLEREAE